MFGTIFWVSVVIIWGILDSPTVDYSRDKNDYDYDYDYDSCIEDIYDNK